MDRSRFQEVGLPPQLTVTYEAVDAAAAQLYRSRTGGQTGWDLPAEEPSSVDDSVKMRYWLEVVGVLRSMAPYTDSSRVITLVCERCGAYDTRPQHRTPWGDYCTVGERGDVGGRKYEQG